MTLFSEFTSWQNFAATKFAEAEVEETRAEAAVRYQEAIVMMQAPVGDRVTVTKALMTGVPEVVAARDRVIQAYANRKMTSVVYGNCERVVSLISRELSRRIGREPTERRSMRWSP